MCPAPICFGSSPPPGASAAPAEASRFGALSRRALLFGAVGAALGPAGGAGAETILDLGKAPGGGFGFGFGGASPGPVLRGRVGEPLRLTLVNSLDVPAPFAWIGMRRAGPPLAPLAPGERRSLEFTPHEPGFGLYGAFGAADLWTGGLFGAVVVEEAGPRPFDVDLTVVFSRADFGRLRVGAGPGPLALQAAQGQRVRLRLVNAAPDMFLPLTALQPVRVVAIDGQPCEPFAPIEGRLPLAPTARAEALFDMGAEPFEVSLAGATAPILRVAASGPATTPGPPIAMEPNPDLPRAIALEKALRVKIALTGAGPYAMGGAGPLFKARRGQPVVLSITNSTPTAQTLRLEGHWARLLHALDDGWDPYWRDTFFLEPGGKALAAFVADTPGLWPLASASPARRAQGLAASYQVA